MYCTRYGTSVNTRRREVMQYRKQLGSRDNEMPTHRARGWRVTPWLVTRADPSADGQRDVSSGFGAGSPWLATVGPGRAACRPRGHPVAPSRSLKGLGNADRTGCADGMLSGGGRPEFGWDPPFTPRARAQLSACEEAQ